MDFLNFLGLTKKGIQVFAFYGPSGTGKSFRAKLVAQQYGIKVIIDDGLLIQDDQILAGHSAKLEKSYMGAVRVALFDDKEHRDSVAVAIQKYHIKKILILGTSEKMVNKIAVRLQLPLPEKYVTIQEIATPEEMEEARRSRQIEGKHVIPVQAYEIKDKRYSKIFVDSVRVTLARKNLLSRFFGKAKTETTDNSKLFEKSVVRPSFSISARKNISHAAIVRMILVYLLEFNNETRIKKISVKTGTAGYSLAITMDIPFEIQIADFTQGARSFVIKMIEKESGILIEDLFLIIDKILPPKQSL